MRRKTQVVLLLFFVPLFLTFSLSEEKAQNSAWIDFAAKSVNFILLFGGLALILAKPLKRFLGELTLSVEKIMQETEKARREAEDSVAAIKKRLQGLEAEILAIRKNGEEAGQKEKERILSLARQEADRIKYFALQEIDAHVLEAGRELREYAAELAVSLAKAKIEKRLTPELHSRLIDESIEGLTKLYEKSHSD
jgi:F-type H+-transporting ATPase subunit b